MAGEPGTIGSGPFDADKLDGAEVGEPPEQLLVAVLGGGEALDTEESPSLVQSRSYMDVEVRIDAADDASCQSGHCHPFVGLGWGDTAPAGRRTGQRRACVGRLLLGHSVRPGVSSGWPGQADGSYEGQSQRTSAGLVESDLAWAPTHTLINPFTEVVDHSVVTSILAAGRWARSAVGVLANTQNPEP